VGAIHVIVEGSVRVSRHGKPLRIAGPHDAIGVIGLLARAAEGFEAIAVTDTLTLEIDADTLSDVFDDHFSIYHHLLQGVARRSLEDRRLLAADGGYSSVSGQCRVLPARPLDLVERIFFLRRAMPLGRSSVTALADLARRVTEVHLPPGARLWSQGDPSGAMMLLVSGWVECVVDGGRQRFRFGPGASVGSLDSLAGVPRWYEPTTEEKLVALRLSAQDLLDVLEDHTQVATELMAVVAGDALEVAERRRAATG
jgi:CRP-like cAMP-binding protein